MQHRSLSLYSTIEAETFLKTSLFFFHCHHGGFFQKTIMVDRNQRMIIMKTDGNVLKKWLFRKILPQCVIPVPSPKILLWICHGQMQIERIVWGLQDLLLCSVVLIYGLRRKIVVKLCVLHFFKVNLRSFIVCGYYSSIDLWS